MIRFCIVLPCASGNHWNWRWIKGAPNDPMELGRLPNYCPPKLFFFQTKRQVFFWKKHHIQSHIFSLRFWRLTFDGDMATRPGFGWHQEVPVTWRCGGWSDGFPMVGWLVDWLVYVYIHIYTLIIHPLPISWDDSIFPYIYDRFINHACREVYYQWDKRNYLPRCMVDFYGFHVR